MSILLWRFRFFILMKTLNLTFTNYFICSLLFFYLSIFDNISVNHQQTFITSMLILNLVICFWGNVFFMLCLSAAHTPSVNLDNKPSLSALNFNFLLIWVSHWSFPILYVWSFVNSFVKQGLAKQILCLYITWRHKVIAITEKTLLKLWENSHSPFIGP